MFFKGLLNLTTVEVNLFSVNKISLLITEKYCTPYEWAFLRALHPFWGWL